MSISRYPGGGLGTPPIEPNIRTLKPYNWPQDKLRVPNGYGSLPPIDGFNRQFVRKEYFAISSVFNNIQLGQQATNIEKIDAYGDFWLTGVAAVMLQDNGSGPVSNDTYYIPLKISDITTGYNLFTPNSWVAAFTPGRIEVPSEVLSSTSGSHSTIPQPYCFMRDGGIKIEVDMNLGAPATNYQINIVLDGWREYSDASR